MASTMDDTQIRYAVDAPGSRRGWFGRVEGGRRLYARVISTWVARRLADGGGSGRVHSVFRRSFNWRDSAGELFTVTTVEPGCIPAGILVDATAAAGLAARGISAGEVVHATARSVCLPQSGVTIDLSGAREEDLSVRGAMRTVESSGLGERARRSGASFSRMGVSAGFAPLLGHVGALAAGQASADSPDPVLRRGAAAVATLAHGYVLGDRCLLYHACRSLTGLGPGLTPSGDDVLVGFVGALHWMREQHGIEREVDMVCTVVAEAVEGQSTAVAQSYVRHAAQGRLPQRLTEYIEAVRDGTPRERERSMQNMARIGSTSGCDMALGALVGFCAAGLRRDRSAPRVRAYG